MRKLILTLIGTTWSEFLMLAFASFMLFMVSLTLLSASILTYIHIIALFHAAALVYWIYRASVLRQGK